MAIIFLLLLLLLLAPFAAYGNINFCSSGTCSGIPTTDTDAVWVASQTSSSSYCGDSGFTLLCLCPAIASTAILTFHSDSTEQITSNGNSLNFYFNCSYGLAGPQIPCLSATSANGFYSIFTNNSTRIDYDSVAMCARMTTDRQWLMSAGEPVLIVASDGLLVRGFQLGWSSAQDSAGCAICEDSGGVCRYNQTAAGSLLFSCFCSSDGFRSDHCVETGGKTGTSFCSKGFRSGLCGTSNRTRDNPTTGNDTYAGGMTKLGSGTRHKNIIIES